MGCVFRFFLRLLSVLQQVLLAMKDYSSQKVQRRRNSSIDAQVFNRPYL